MTRRALLILLDPAVERPELRVFEERDLLGRIAEDREALLTALFTILKGYQQAGYPDAHANPLGRFEQWCAAVCGPIRWMGYPQSVEQLMEAIEEFDIDDVGIVSFPEFMKIMRGCCA